MSTTRGIRSILLATAATSVLLPASVWAQSSPAPAAEAATSKQADADPVDASSDIIVTARRRNETSIATPVAITAITGTDLQRRGISTVDSLARTIPTLITSEATSSPQGGIVAIRGLSGVDSNAFADQAVSFNIDGVQIARSSVRRLSEMDIAQIEVLKGPQALFFGKNSPAGIISIRTADPTDTLRAQFSSGYEFNADETRNEGYVSAPITPTLGFRVAGYYDHMRGYVLNVAPSTGVGVLAPFDRHVPNGTEYAIRGTLKWTPSDRFDARLKLSYNDVNTSGSTDDLQYVACPLGTPQDSLPPEDCVADAKTTATDNIGTNFQSADPRLTQQTYLVSRQTLGGLELNYKLADHVQLSSITGYYKGINGYIGSFTANFAELGAPPRTFLPASNRLDIREISQELRLTTSFDGPVNFLVGGFYQDSHASVAGVVYRNAITPIFSANYAYQQEGIAYSIFEQSTVKFFSTLELSVGARYSYERKVLTLFQSAVPTAPTVLVNVDSPNRAVFNNLSPEATLSYRPSSNLTLYGSYKEGFLSGGFNATQPSVSATKNPLTGNLTSLTDPRYQQQLIAGFEGGVKFALLDNALRVNLDAYTYKTTGLQVAVLVGLQQVLANAGAVRTKGVEADFSYRTPISGLFLNGALSYEKGTYIDYQATCYRGLPAPQCVNQVDHFTGQVGLLHDLSGTQLVRAPTWSGNVGFDYTSPSYGRIKFGVDGNASHSDSFFTDVVSAPGGRQGAYDLFDAGIRVMDVHDRWEVALLGRNLGNTFYFTRSADNPFSGSAPGGSAATSFGGDTVAVPSRGREIMLKATIRFGG